MISRYDIIFISIRRWGSSAPCTKVCELPRRNASTCVSQRIWVISATFLRSASFEVDSPLELAERRDGSRAVGVVVMQVPDPSRRAWGSWYSIHHDHTRPCSCGLSHGIRNTAHSCTTMLHMFAHRFSVYMSVVPTQPSAHGRAQQRCTRWCATEECTENAHQAEANDNQCEI